MGVYSGPEIVNSGLVFHYDMYNTQKSWKGKPTTNLYSGNYGDTGTTDGFGGGSYLDTTLQSKDPFNLSTISARKSNAGIATWSVSATLTEGVTYTYSIWCKTVSWTSVTMRRNEPGVYVQENKSVSVTPGVWTRVNFTFTVSAGKSGSQVVGIGVGNANVGGDNQGIFLFGAQLEQQTFASAYTTGTRSNTQAIIDTTKNNIITASSLTYNSDGTFSFGGSDYLSIPTIDFSNAQTIEIWLKPTESDGVRRNPYNQAYGGFGTWTHEPSGYFNYYYGDAGNDNSPYIGHSSSFTVSQNEIACVCTTRNTSESWWYKNGQQYNSYTHSFGSLAATASNVLIGTGYAGAYIGNIYSVKLYNRALTASEVKQNFEAQRYRYGI